MFTFKMQLFLMECAWNSKGDLIITKYRVISFGDRRGRGKQNGMGERSRKHLKMGRTQFENQDVII